MLNIQHGSIFDEKCDLIILPCDSGGGVTPWVEREIIQNNLPFPSMSIPFGSTLFQQTTSYNKAEHIGYAASVNAKTVSSNISAISKIIDNIIKYCHETDSSIINIPTLGAGAGNIDMADVISLYEKKLSTTSLNFNVFIPDAQNARLFAQKHPSTNHALAYENPRVFISYSWKDEKIKDWTFDLATKLRQNGIDARLDRFHMKPGMDMPQWMTNEIIKANKVILVCDQHYAEKSDTRKAGVGWETMIIQGDMLIQGDMNSKYIVVACGGFDKNIPIYMKSKLGIAKETIDKDLNEILGILFDVDTTPEIGEIPSWVKKKREKQKASN